MILFDNILSFFNLTVKRPLKNIFHDGVVIDELTKEEVLRETLAKKFNLYFSMFAIDLIKGLVKFILLQSVNLYGAFF
jgi:hypothetical protein